MRSSPDRARALPLSMSGMAAGLSEKRIVVVVNGFALCRCGANDDAMIH